ncbi:class I SAM-dependent methyltransferase [Periweissella fabalis]|uniref:Class I SAM-dependent methyltransferase n=1 Tax=Periweissella fabalis TaxID=1070421 RepID=A0A7X6N2R1_9LACO|nr:class I SAM-dependent methyltransferase [Periweissella fabalis]MCM0598499.1 class I SAM-dependent methyltransferase [Periweissella fabalis]NKZ24219.1 class I SAM-dependent methyltransferase [Periweissella fabalis]
MEQAQVEELYRVLDQASQLLAEDLDSSYLEALIEICENILQKTIQVENNQPSPNVAERLKTLLNGINLDKYSADDIRRGIGLAYLRAVQVDNIQATHHQTPDSIATLVTYIVAKIVKPNVKVDVLDPVVGIGNLLAMVVNYLKESNQLASVNGVEIDDTLLALTGISFDLQHITNNLIEGDARDVELPVADIIVADIPLLHQTDAIAADTQIIYAANKSLKPAGIAIYVVPNNILETDNAADFLSRLTQTVYVQGIIKFAPSTFKNEKADKALLIVQRQGNNAQQAAQVLLAQVPALKAKDALPKFFVELDQWITTL